MEEPLIYLSINWKYRYYEAERNSYQGRIHVHVAIAAVLDSIKHA